jgi:hypothetical protein
MDQIVKHVAALGTIIGQYQFERATNYLMEEVPAEHRLQALHLATEEHLGVLAYTFASRNVAVYGSSFWHRAAAMVVLESLDALPNKTAAAYYHLHQAMELDPNDAGLKEYVLQFHKEGLVSDEEAQVLAQALLQQAPKSAMAQAVLEHLGKQPA